MKNNDLLQHQKAYSVEDIQKSHPNAYKSWTSQEEDELMELHRRGLSTKKIAEALGRQPGGIRSRLKKLGFNTKQNAIIPCRIFKDPKINTIAEEEVFFFGIYNQYYKGTNPRFDNFSRRILDVKNQRMRGINYFVAKLKEILSDDSEFMICMMPGHDMDNEISGIKMIAKRLCTDKIIDGTEVLNRIFEIPKKSTGGIRDEELDLLSLEVNKRHSSSVRKYPILLLDDVLTTGTTLKAGEHKLIQEGASVVALLSLGKTYGGGMFK